MAARALVILPFLMLVLACSSPAATPPPGEDSALVDRLAAAAREAAAHTVGVDLGKVAGHEWEIATVFGPYSDSEVARETLGFDWNLDGASPWTNSEGGAVIVLAGGDHVVAWTAVPSSKLGLHCIYGRSFRRSEAVFSASLDTSGRPGIYARDDSLCRP